MEKVVNIESSIKELTDRNDKTFRYVETTITKGKSKWTLIDCGGDYIDVTKSVNGKRSAIASPMGKTFFGWSEIVENYKSIRVELDKAYNVHMSNRTELQVLKILN